MRRRTRLHSSTRTTTVDQPADRVWAVVASGAEGPHWYVDALPFAFRGAVDRLLGGEGRRWPAPGRPLLRAEDEVGFWRVTSAARHLLDLEASVRAPGVVRLHTRVDAVTDERCRLTQIVHFEPDGLSGQLYMLADLPAREAVVELAHRRLLSDLARS